MSDDRNKNTPDADEKLEENVERDVELDGDNSDFEESEGEESKPIAGAERRGRPRNVEELLTQDLGMRASKSNDLLRSKLKGRILLKIRGSDPYLVDWTGSELSVKRAADSNADTVIEAEERDIMKISMGNLNPQIAMLSDKMKVSGNPELAIYFFNLVAP